MAGTPAPKERPAKRRRATGNDSDLSLFSTEGPFECFPGPVMLAGNNGIVLAANSRAGPIGASLKAGGPAELREAITSALRGYPAQINPLFLPVDESGGAAPRAYDVVVLPWGEGSAALLMARDVTLERGLRAALIESRQRFKELVEIAGDFAWETDAQGRFTFLSTASVLGHAAVQLIGESAADLLVEGPDPFICTEKMAAVELAVRCADGTAVRLEVTAAPLFGEDGAWRGARGLCRAVAVPQGCDGQGQDPQAAGGAAAGRGDALARVLQTIRAEQPASRVLATAADSLISALGVAGVAIYRRSLEGETTLEVRTGMPLPDGLIELLRCAVAGDKDEVEASSQSGNLLARLTRHDSKTNGILGVWRSPRANGWSAAERHFLGQIAGEIGAANERLCQAASRMVER